MLIGLILLACGIFLGWFAKSYWDTNFPKMQKEVTNVISDISPENKK